MLKILKDNNVAKLSKGEFVKIVQAENKNSEETLLKLGLDQKNAVMYSKNL